MSNSSQQSNLQQQQQQYMQQYQQYQQFLQGYNQQYWGQDAQMNNNMDGPSFTGEASVFRARDIRYNDTYGDRESSSRAGGMYRSRSRSRDRDEPSDSRSDKRLQETLKRLRQLEEQQVMQVGD